MKTNKIISIIVPVYQAEKTVKRCIDSLKSDTDDIEIICVDDGSKDQSGKILDDIAKENRNIKVIHQKNVGAGAARNTGIANAQGEYIMFCDSDDTYLPETLGYIIEDIQEYEPDYIVFHRKTIRTDGVVQWWGQGNERTILDCTWSYYMNHVMYERRHGMGVVTKVYRRSIIARNHVEFNSSLELGEDQWFNMTYLIHARLLIEDFRAVYQQFQTAGSLCIRKRNDFYVQNLECVHLFIELYPEESKKIQVFIDKTRYMSADRALQRIFEKIDGESFQSSVRICHMILKDENLKKSIQKISDLPELAKDKEKLRLLLKEKLLGYWLKYYAAIEIKKIIKKIIRRR